jgi:hypothetical protein
VHVQRRTSAVGIAGVAVILQSALDDDEEGTEKLTAGPAHGAADLGAERVGDLDEELERDWDETEAGGAEYAEDHVGKHDGTAGRSPDEEEVAEPDERYGGFDVGEVELGAVDQWRGERGGDEADKDEEGASDTGL